jgi:hypothetical protein
VTVNTGPLLGLGLLCRSSLGITIVSTCKGVQSYGDTVATKQMHGVAPNFETFELPRAPPLSLSLEHAPSVPQGVESDKLIKDVHMIMYLN